MTSIFKEYLGSKRSFFQVNFLDDWQFFNPKFRIPRIIFLSLIGLACLVSLFFIIKGASDLPPMHRIENPQSDLSTQLISADGEVLQKFYSRENRINLELHEISPYVIDALLATEDVRFYQHSGIDPKSFFSILSGVIKGEGARGGSTIDMQLTRNLYGEKVGNQSTLMRKIKEYFVSVYIERRFTKREIMAAYLNTVNIYGDSYGIETTANRLFNKNAKDLTIEEAAMLIGMLKGQGVYNPIRYPDRTQKRRNLVIDQMIKYGFINFDSVKLDSIKNIPIEIVKQDQEHLKGLAPYFREHLRTELSKWCEANGFDLYTSGLRVYTTLNTKMQRHAEAAVKAHLTALQRDFDKFTFGQEDWRKDSASVVQMIQSTSWNNYWTKNKKVVNDLKRQSYRYISLKRENKSLAEIDQSFSISKLTTLFSWDGNVEVEISPLDSIRYYAGILETGMVSIEPNTGYVTAWVGGNDYRFFKYDHVAKGKRQVGSTFKPFVYAAAINQGYSPCYEIPNQPIRIGGDPERDPGTPVWQPNNSEGNYGGFLTLKEGLAGSKNMITARLMQSIRPRMVAQLAYNMGIESEIEEVYSLALGTTDLSVLELTGAYCTFPNNGLPTIPMMVTRIEDKSGTVLAEFTVKHKQRALQEDKAYTMVQLLRGVVDSPGGTARRLRFKYKLENEIGAKTGTTQNHSDGWFMGFMPNLTCGVWVGCADRRMHFKSLRYGQGANMALPIWALYVKGVLEDKSLAFPVEHFIAPGGFSVDFSCNADQADEYQGPQPTNEEKIINEF